MAPVADSKLTGTTDGSDYFYFVCPTCQDGQVMRILDYGIEHEGLEGYPHLRPKAKRDFKITLQLHCPACKHEDFVKISNTGLQGGRVDWKKPKDRA